MREQLTPSPIAKVPQRPVRWRWTTTRRRHLLADCCYQCLKISAAVLSDAIERPKCLIHLVPALEHRQHHRFHPLEEPERRGGPAPHPPTPPPAPVPVA